MAIAQEDTRQAAIVCFDRKELSRFEALSPALSACAPPEQEVELTKFLVRGTIALNYYRLAQAAHHVAIH